MNRIQRAASLRIDAALIQRLAVQLDQLERATPEERARVADHHAKLQEEMNGAIERARVQLQALDRAGRRAPPPPPDIGGIVERRGDVDHLVFWGVLVLAGVAIANGWL